MMLIDTSRCIACRACQVACKAWHGLPAEEPLLEGTCQNRPALSFATRKLVRMVEEVIGGRLRWLFFPEQCRHCIEPSCMYEAADEAAIYKDPASGAVVFTAKTRELDGAAIMDACPYGIVQQAPDGTLAKCDMCVDRLRAGLEPACVKACPAGAMHFGEACRILALAKERLARVKPACPDAVLGDPEDVQVLYLTLYPPWRYHEFACLPPGLEKGISRQAALRKMAAPWVKAVRHFAG